jgi:hypothetical protein
MYRLHMNRCVQAYRRSNRSGRRFSKSCGGRYQELFHAGAASPKGV